MYICFMFIVIIFDMFFLLYQNASNNIYFSTVSLFYYYPSFNVDE